LSHSRQLTHAEYNEDPTFKPNVQPKKQFPDSSDEDAPLALRRKRRKRRSRKRK
jgi:hypothetical protein